MSRSSHHLTCANLHWRQKGGGTWWLDEAGNADKEGEEEGTLHLLCNSLSTTLIHRHLFLQISDADWYRHISVLIKHGIAAQYWCIVIKKKEGDSLSEVMEQKCWKQPSTNCYFNFPFGSIGCVRGAQTFFWRGCCGVFSGSPCQTLRALQRDCGTSFPTVIDIWWCLFTAVAQSLKFTSVSVKWLKRPAADSSGTEWKQWTSWV